MKEAVFQGLMASVGIVAIIFAIVTIWADVLRSWWGCDFAGKFKWRWLPKRRRMLICFIWLPGGVSRETQFNGLCASLWPLL